MRKASDIITALFRDKFGSEFMETARSTAGLFSSWTKIVTEVWPRTFGDDRIEDDIPAAAVHSRIRELERGLLLIEADHPGWIQILQTKQKELLASVQRRYPGLSVRGIAFRLGREPFSSSVYEGRETRSNIQDAPRQEYETPEERCPEPGPARRRSQGPRDEKFYAALEKLEESVKKRNRFGK